MVSAERQSIEQSLSVLTRRLDESAREHKRLEAEHRAAARRDRATIDQILAFCEAAGIRVIQHSKGAKLNGRRHPGP